MMGLLDDNFRIRTGDPDRDAQISRGLLMAGLQLMQSKGRLLPALGQAGLTGVQASDQTAQMQQARQMQQMQQQMGKYALGREQREADLAALPGQFYRPPSAPAIDATGGMETAVEAPNNASGPGGMDYAGLLQAYMGKGALPQAAQLKAFMQKPERELKEYDPQKSLYYTGKDGNPVFVREGSPKGEAPTPDWKDYQRAVEQGYQGKFLDYQREMANLKAPKTQVQVNTGQKGYENESKLRNDFKSEPIYKDYADMVQAHKQIKAGIAQGNPIGDVAAATKIMKLLDPGSVVRESELGIAMAAAGKLDRMSNYLQMQISGQKLTPTQRQEFGKLADELMEAAGQGYNAKRSEYATMGQRYGLDPTVLGAPFQATAQRPQGVPQNLWDAMTPQERALWKK